MKKICAFLLILIVTCSLFAFSACDAKKDGDKAATAPSSLDAAVELLRSAGYRVDTYEYEETDEEKGLYGLLWELLAETEGETEYLDAFFFESEEKAKAYLQEFREEYAEECAEDREDGENVTFGQAGKWVYYGTVGAEKTLLGK